MLSGPTGALTHAEKQQHIGFKNGQLKPYVLKSIVDKFNQWWSDRYNGMQIHFEFGNDDYKYLTTSEPAAARNRILNQRLQSLGINEPITILEGFVGCGADTITFISDMKPQAKLIYTCDEKPEKLALAKKNVENFKKAYHETFKDSPRTDVKILPLSLKNLIYQEIEPGAIDLLYLDPPWENQNGTGEVGGSALVEFLDEHAFQPIMQWVSGENRPKLIVIKTRFDADAMKKLQVPGYIFVDTLDFTPFRQEVHFHTLQSTMCRTHHVWHPSRNYVQLYPSSAQNNKIGWHDDVKHKDQYYIEYVNKEDKTPYWITKEGKKQKKKIKNAEPSIKEYVPSREGRPPKYLVGPVENTPQQSQTHQVEPSQFQDDDANQRESDQNGEEFKVVASRSKKNAAHPVAVPSKGGRRDAASLNMFDVLRNRNDSRFTW